MDIEINLPDPKRGIWRLPPVSSKVKPVLGPLVAAHSRIDVLSCVKGHHKEGIRRQSQGLLWPGSYSGILNSQTGVEPT